ncbi:MAG: type II toxin-antitoxin system VapC family toxin [Candidatus Woesearchaeota archaeon]
MNVFLDTSAVIELERKNPQIHNKYAKIARACIPCVVRAELLQGAKLSRKKHAEKQVRELISSFRQASFDEESADIFSELSVRQIRAGTIKSPIDTMILACAIQHGADILVTQNPKDFRSELFAGRVCTIEEL